jgi:hypothetical protein
VKPISEVLALISLANIGFTFRNPSSQKFRLPSPGFSPFEAADAEPPDGTARRSARDGVTSTLTMATEMVPGNTNGTRFCQYQPAASKPALVESWQRNIGTDCATRVEAYRQTRCSDIS